MYNKKCNSTFLFIMALACLLTLIVPFMNVKFLGNPALILKILYYTMIVIFGICVVLIIVIGIYSLFKNNFFLVSIQETLTYISLVVLLINILVFLPCHNVGLSAGYSILVLETFIMANLSHIMKLIKRLPNAFKNIKTYIKEQKTQKEKLKLEKQVIEQKLLEIEQNKQENALVSENKAEDFNDDIVQIIPPDDDII